MQLGAGQILKRKRLIGRPAGMSSRKRFRLGFGAFFIISGVALLIISLIKS